jgi:hypothetical protein
MKKVFFVLIAFIVIFPLYSQDHYVLNVSAEWMDTFATPVTFTGDYNGEAMTSFRIGPYNQPFTVTLTIVNEYENALAADLVFAKWNLADDDSHSVTITVDNSKPVVDAVALYANIEPTPPTLPDDSIGTVWLEPAQKIVSAGSAFGWEVHVKTGDQMLAAYGLEIMWPVPEGGVIMYVDTSVGINGVEAGVDGFVAAAGAEAPGIIVISGFDTQGTGPSDDLHLCTVHFIASQRGVSGAVVDLSVNTLVDPSTMDIGIPTGIGGTIIVEADFTLGDANEDGDIDIVDALLIAQYYVNTSTSINTSLCDVNCDGTVDIIDALRVAQYYVGIIGEFSCPGTTPGPGLTYVPGEIIVGFYDWVTLEQANDLVQSYNLTWEDSFPTSHSVWLEVDGDPDYYITLLESYPIVRWADLRGYSNGDPDKTYIIAHINGMEEEAVELISTIDGLTIAEHIVAGKWGVVDVPVGDESEWIEVFSGQSIVEHASLNGIVTID